MSESNEPSPASTREPQQQSPSTSTSAASEPQPSSTAASAASDPPRHQSHEDAINLTGDGLSSEPARAVAGGIDTAGIDKGLWQPNKRAVAFYWRFFWRSMLTYDMDRTVRFMGASNKSMEIYHRIICTRYLVYRCTLSCRVIVIIPLSA